MVRRLKDQIGQLRKSTLLRWAGSKRKLLPLLTVNVPRKFNRYIEPFAGSACLFFSVISSSNAAILGDFNEELLDFYRIVKKRPNALFSRLTTFDESKDFYYSLRAVDPSRLSRTHAAARFLYLNRFCFNGVYRTNQSGKFNVPYGTKTGRLPNLAEIEFCSRALKNVDFSPGDFELTLSKATRGDFVYLDPPYASSRNRGEYGYGAFCDSDFERLNDALVALDRKGASFLLSYKQDESTVNAFARWNSREVSVRRHVAGFVDNRGMVTELLVSNQSILGASN